VTDRDQNYDTTNNAPDSSVPATLAPADKDRDVFNTAGCVISMMGLSYDWIELGNKISTLAPATSYSTTNQAIGLQWGFQTLTSSPFTIPPKDPNYKNWDIIILLSDGLNTVNRWNAYGSSNA
jgi:hypothetical protein